MNKVLLCCLLALASCEKPAPTVRSYPVCIGEVTVQDVPEFIRGIGQLIPSIQIDVRAQVSGLLASSIFPEGGLVNEGDLLMVIDQRPFIAQLQSAEAQLVQDQAKLRYALDFAETYGSLVGKEFVSRLDYQQGIQNVDVLKGAIEADLAAIETAKINLGFTEIRSPTKGYASLRTPDPGNYIDASKGNVLVSILKVTPLLVRFSLPSAYVQSLRELLIFENLYFEAFLPDDTRPLKGEVNFIDNTVNADTGMIVLEGTIPNEDERGWPGQFIRVNLMKQMVKDALLVPLSAMMLGQEGHYVFRVKDDMTVEYVKVSKVFEYDQQVVIQGDLKPGEKIVLDGQLNLFEGAKVHVPELEDSFLPCSTSKAGK